MKDQKITSEEMTIELEKLRKDATAAYDAYDVARKAYVVAYDANKK